MENLMGYKFQPSTEQILYLLVEKRLHPHFSHHRIKDIVDICSLEPWDFATESKAGAEDQVWYFFCEPYYKYRKSNRVHRRTKAGHWKITSKDSQIEARNGLTGTKKILTFYRHGAASKDAITEWVMHEYHVKDDPSYKKEFVFSRIERKQKKKKHGTLTTDEGESSKQLISPPLSVNPVLPTNSNLESQLPVDHPSVIHNFAENNFQKECQPIGEFNSYRGYNRLNDACFPAVHRPIYQEQELIFETRPVTDLRTSSEKFIYIPYVFINFK